MRGFEAVSSPMTGFLLDTDPELPAEARSALPENGRTLAFAIFPAFQRKGYMEEAMRAYIPYLFSNTGTGYIHCGHFTENVPSRELLHKLEFREYSKHALKDRIIVDEIRFRCAGFRQYHIREMGYEPAFQCSGCGQYGICSRSV